MVVNEYFPSAKLCQFDVIKALKDLANKFINSIVNDMVDEHKAENRKICEAFEEIVEKAQQVSVVPVGSVRRIPAHGVHEVPLLFLFIFRCQPTRQS